MTTNPTITKIKALLAQANHPTTGAAESEAFRQKAFELMLKHGLSQNDVVDKDAFKVESKRLHLKSTCWREDVQLAGVVATANGAVVRYQAYDSYHGGAFAVFYGEADRIEVCELMFNSLVAQRARASRRRPAHETPREFASGFAVGVSITLKRAQKEVEKEDGNLLPALLNSAARIEAELNKARKSRMQPAEAGRAGINAGLSADTGIHARLNEQSSRAIGAGR